MLMQTNTLGYGSAAPAAGQQEGSNCIELLNISLACTAVAALLLLVLTGMYDAAALHDLE